MITKCSECTVRVFMACLFDGKLELLQGGDFSKIHTEFMDISKMGDTKELELLTAIHNTHTRILFIEAMLSFHRLFFKEMGVPYVNGFASLKPHRLKWDEKNPGSFLEQLNAIETIEKKHVAELDKYEKELSAIKKEGFNPYQDGREAFVRQLSNLGRYGYKIDRDTTDMEELGIMICDYDAAMRAAAAKNKK